MSDDLLFAVQGRLGVITLNRPEALNALTLPMILALQHHLSLWNNDSAIKAIVIRAVPGVAFCAGGDVRSLYQQKQQKEQIDFFWHEYRLNHFIHHLSKPYIALLDGITMGGGVGISLHGSHAIASERFVFAMPETSIGFFPDIGASHLLTRAPDAIGIYLGLTGNRLSAEEAHYAKLINGRMSSAAMPLFLDDLSNYSWGDDVYEDVGHCLSRYQNNESFSFSGSERIEQCFSLANVESIFSALEQHDAWGRELLQTLKQKAPFSLKLTLAQLQKAQGYSLAHCLMMDYDIVQHCMQGVDFYEGVRALLVDKDKKPQWSPATLEQVNDVSIAHYFQPTSSQLEFI